MTGQTRDRAQPRKTTSVQTEADMKTKKHVSSLHHWIESTK